MLLPLAEIAPDRVIAGIRVGDALARVDTTRHRKAAAAVAPPPVRGYGAVRHGTCTANRIGPQGQAWHFASMTAPKPLSFAGDFPAATHDDWRKLVDAVLKGAPFKRLESRTYDGLTIEPLYERAAGAPPCRAAHRASPWTLMQRVDHPDPAAANAQALDDLENGATGLVLVFAGSVSANGFGLDATAATLTRVLDGIDLAAGIAIDLNLSPSLAAYRPRFRRAMVKDRGMAPAARRSAL